MDLNEIPKSASSITAEWLTTALALEDNQQVLEVSVEEMEEGVGFIGEVARLHFKIYHYREETMI